MTGPAVRQGDTVRVVAFSAFAATIVAHATARFPNGETQVIRVPEFTTGTSLAQENFDSKDVFEQDGEIVDAVVLNRTAGKKGQTYANLQTRRGNNIQTILAAGYTYGGRGLTLGMNEDMLTGKGYNRLVTIASDATGDAGTTYDPSTTNILRRVKGIIAYLACDGTVASRSLQIIVRRVYGARPTGFSGADELYQSTGVTLTADEDGAVFISENEGFVAFNDAGTVTYADNSTAPHPFPFTVSEGDTTEIVIRITNGVVGDLYSAYALVEEWIDI